MNNELDTYLYILFDDTLTKFLKISFSLKDVWLKKNKKAHTSTTIKLYLIIYRLFIY
jgi:hypothetical protein